MCLPESYHGETIGALSVGSMDLYAKIFHPMLMNNIHFKGLDCYRCPYGKTRETCGVECFEDAEAAFKKYGKETVACIVEPILQGAAGDVGGAARRERHDQAQGSPLRLRVNQSTE